MQAEGATISADMDSSSTNHLILSPASQGIFDSFCHPDWIPLKFARVREARKETWDVWRGKVLLKSKWVGLCQREGRYLVCDTRHEGPFPRARGPRGETEREAEIRP